MRVGLFTREYPPNVYGGAGVHVDYLSRELAKNIEVEVHCWGDQHVDEGNLHVRGEQPWAEITQGTDGKFRAALETLSLNLTQIKALTGVDIVHTHTWYVSLAGFLAKKLYRIPFVLTTHSLEPFRAWKAEQLGRGYDISSWVERTAILDADAVIAVSKGTKADICSVYPVDPDRVHVIYNGIDLDEYQQDYTNERAGGERSRSVDSLRSFCRAHYTAKGRDAPGRCDSVFAAGNASSPLRGRAGHAGDRRGNAVQSGRSPPCESARCLD